jgi:hypothetical protein
VSQRTRKTIQSMHTPALAGEEHHPSAAPLTKKKPLAWCVVCVCVVVRVVEMVVVVEGEVNNTLPHPPPTLQSETQKVANHFANKFRLAAGSTWGRALEKHSHDTHTFNCRRATDWLPLPNN